MIQSSQPRLGSQLFPPSVVCRIIPYPPTIQPLFSSKKSIDRIQVVSGIPSWAFFQSPSRSCSTRPAAPTIQPLPSSNKRKAYNGSVEKAARSSAVKVHVLPPSVVFTTFPSMPTAIPSVAFLKRTPKRAGKLSRSEEHTSELQSR